MIGWLGCGYCERWWCAKCYNVNEERAHIWSMKCKKKREVGSEEDKEGRAKIMMEMMEMMKMRRKERGGEIWKENNGITRWDRNTGTKSKQIHDQHRRKRRCSLNGKQSKEKKRTNWKSREM